MICECVHFKLQGSTSNASFPSSTLPVADTVSAETDERSPNSMHEHCHSSLENIQMQAEIDKIKQEVHILLIKVIGWSITSNFFYIHSS